MEKQNKKISAVEECRGEFLKINARLEELESRITDRATDNEDSELLQQLKQQMDDLDKRFEEIHHELAQSAIEEVREKVEKIADDVKQLMDFIKPEQLEGDGSIKTE